MNRFKFFTFTNLLFHICFLFTCPIPFMANVVGAIPLVIYATILSFMVKETDTYWSLFKKSVLIFLTIAVGLSIIETFLLVGILLSSLGIILGLLIQPKILRYCK